MIRSCRPFPDRLANASGFAPDLVSRTLDTDDSQRVVAVAEQHDVPVSVVLLTAWQILLARLTGQSEVIVAVAADGRNHEDLADSVGLFERYLPIRLGFDETPAVRASARKIKDPLERGAKRQGYFSWELLAEPGENRAEPYCAFGFDFSVQPAQCKAGDVTFAIDELRGCTDRFAIRLSCVQSTRAHHRQAFTSIRIAAQGPTSSD